MKKAVFVIVSILVSLGFLLSCDQGDVGMFYSLEVESEVLDNSLDNNITVGSMVKYGTDYYIAAGTVLRRGETETDWTEVPFPTSGYFCTEIAVFDSLIYAVWTKIDGAASVLYTLSAGVWTEVSEMNAYYCTGLIFVPDAADPALFIVVKETDSSYTLWYKTTGVAPAHTNVKYTIPMTGAARFNGEIYLVAGDKLFQGPAAGSLVLSQNVPPKASAALYNAAATAQKPDGTELLFVSTSDGYLFANDGNVWGAASASVDTELYGISRMSFEDTDGVIKTNLLVGSKSGYFEVLLGSDINIDALTLSKPGTQSLKTTGINYVNTTLSKNVVRKFFYDDLGEPANPGPHVIFALTAGNGLWVNRGNEASRSWSIE